MNALLNHRRSFRPAVQRQGTGSTPTSTEHSSRKSVLIVDLNNFSTFPTLAIGLLVAALRRSGHTVTVLSPLAHDVPAAERERRETWKDHLARRIQFTTNPVLLRPRGWVRALRKQWIERTHKIVLKEFQLALDRRPDIVLLSAYLQHFHTVRQLGAMAEASQIPVLLGGPMFNIKETADAWRSLPGLTAVVGAEADLIISDLVTSVCNGEDLKTYPGLTFPAGETTARAQPLRTLDATPIADFTDFPWDRYRVQIVPVMTGRGCQWDKCTFCSDVVSVSGRTFRTRSVEHVLSELQEQHRRHATSNFLFLDLKLNSYPDMIRGIASDIQTYVHGAEWIGTVHVDQRKDNGLSRRDLMLAAAGGMRRISFGLESGSQRLLDSMRKGTSVEANADFIRNAHEAGLSVRCTMFRGYPGEDVEDMLETVSFLSKHADYIDRVRFNEFSLLMNTPIYNEMVSKGGSLKGLEIDKTVSRRSRAEYINPSLGNAHYRSATQKALNIVHAINSRPVRSSARQFDGLM